MLCDWDVGPVTNAVDRNSLSVVGKNIEQTRCDEFIGLK